MAKLGYNMSIIINNDRDLRRISNILKLNKYIYCLKRIYSLSSWRCLICLKKLDRDDLLVSFERFMLPYNINSFQINWNHSEKTFIKIATEFGFIHNINSGSCRHFTRPLYFNVDDENRLIERFLNTNFGNIYGSKYGLK
jgi:hypothetical protein